MKTLAHLLSARRRLDSISYYTPESSEIARFRDIIIPDLESKLTDLEKAELNKAASIKTPAELKAARDAEIAAMEANRDKPSI